MHNIIEWMAEFMKGVKANVAVTSVVTVMCAGCIERVEPSQPQIVESESTRDVVMNKSTSVVQLREAFLSGRVNEVGDATRAVLHSGKNSEMLAYILGVWALDQKVVSELDPTFIRSAAVRAYIAHVLATLAGNREITIDLIPVREALRVGLSVPDREVGNFSSYGLSFIAEPIDIDKFVELAKESNTEVSALGLTALANACGEYAARQLDDIKHHSDNLALRKEAEAMQSALSESRAARCRH